MHVDLDDSSAGETPRSPEHDDPNSTTATPERTNSWNNNMGFRTTAMKLFEAGNMQAQSGAASPVREKDRERMQPARRDSWIGRLKDKLSSPGRGEIHRPEHSGAVEKRVKKRRDQQLQRQVSRRRRHSVSDTGEDSDAVSKKRKIGRSPRKNDKRRSEDDEEDEKPPSRDQKNWLSSLFTFIAQHPTVPHILSFYAQLAFNIFLLAACAYLIFCFWAAVQGDVDKKSFEATAEILAESAACLKEWTTNKCAPETRLPALEAMCNSWEKCMKRDAGKVARARLSARTFAEIYNELIEPISWKAMVCLLICFLSLDSMI
jgi:hypothetical protein